MQRISCLIRMLGRWGFVVLLLGVTVLTHSQQIIWEREGAGDSSRYGGTIFGLGDQNDDGFDDFGVYATGWGNPGNTSERLSEFFYGGNPPVSIPYRIFRSQSEPPRQFSGSVPIGDLNGDMIEDWIAAWYIQSTGNFDCYFYAGGPDPNSPPLLNFTMPLGIYFQRIGDINDDEFDDLGVFYGQRLYIYFGSASFELDTDWSCTMWGAFTGSDINGDGFSDIIERSPSNLWIHYGAFVPDTLRDIELGIQTSHVHAADLNGDNQADIMTARSAEGWLYIDVILGSDSILPITQFILDVPCREGILSRIASLGDINADGYGDLGIASEFCSGNSWGIASVWLGYSWLNPDPVYTFEGRSAPWNLIGIREIAGVGDVNGDSIDDFAIGAFDDDFDGFRGRAIIIAGNPDLQVEAREPRLSFPNELSLSVFPNPFNSTLSIALDVPINQEVSVSLYDLLGREVDVIYRGRMLSNSISYAAPVSLASGVYFVRAVTANSSVMGKVVLLK